MSLTAWSYVKSRRVRASMLFLPDYISKMKRAQWVASDQPRCYFDQYCSTTSLGRVDAAYFEAGTPITYYDRRETITAIRPSGTGPLALRVE